MIRSDKRCLEYGLWCSTVGDPTALHPLQFGTSTGFRLWCSTIDDSSGVTLPKVGTSCGVVRQLTYVVYSEINSLEGFASAAYRVAFTGQYLLSVSECWSKWIVLGRHTLRCPAAC